MGDRFDIVILNWTLHGVIAAALAYFLLKTNMSEAVSVAAIALASRGIVRAINSYWDNSTFESRAHVAEVSDKPANVWDGFTPSILG
jgi:hypothetical protein